MIQQNAPGIALLSSADQGLDLTLLIVIGAGVLLIPLIGMTIRRTSTWTGLWRFVAVLPLLAMVGLIIHMVMNPGSAGLWPIVIIFWGVIAMLVLAVVTAMHAMIERWASHSKGGDDPSDSDGD